MINQTALRIFETPIQEWKTIQGRRIRIKRDDMLPLGLGTKLRRHSGFLKWDTQYPVTLRGSFHSNFLASFALLFSLHGYTVHTYAHTRDKKFHSANSLLTKRFSDRLSLGTSREVDGIWEEALNNRNQNHIPLFGIHPFSLKSLHSLWEEIPIEKFTHVFVDMGSGLTWLSGLNSLSSKHSHKLHGIMLGEEKGKWIQNLPNLMQFVGMSFSSMESTHPTWMERIWEPTILSGFGKVNERLKDYITSIYKTTGLPLEPFYSAKSLFTLENSILSLPKDSEILYVHQGGLLNWLDLFL